MYRVMIRHVGECRHYVMTLPALPSFLDAYDTGRMHVRQTGDWIVSAGKIEDGA